MSADPLIRACYLAGVIGISTATLNAKIKCGRIPPPDARTHGNAKLWRLSTLRQWDAQIASGIETLLAIQTVRNAA